MRNCSVMCLSGLVESMPKEIQIPIQQSHFPSTQDLKRIRRIATKTRASRACSTCKLTRQRCGDYRPCGRCQANGLDAACANELSLSTNTKKPRLERPIACSPVIFKFVSGSSTRDGGLKYPRAMLAIRPFWFIGYRPSSHETIFSALPTSMLMALDTIYAAIDYEVSKFQAAEFRDDQR